MKEKDKPYQINRAITHMFPSLWSSFNIHLLSKKTWYRNKLCIFTCSAHDYEFTFHILYITETIIGEITIYLWFFRCGGGKTAVFIAVDYCLKELEAEGHVDVYSAVLYLRKFRKNMVRTLVGNFIPYITRRK